MNERIENYGRTIQLFLVDGSPSGLIIAGMHGWTGSLLVCQQATFARMLSRPELDRVGVYILYGPDEKKPQKACAYIGEADIVADRIESSAKNHGFWETAVAITTSDDALTKGHVRYLEARLLELAKEADRVTLANTQMPPADKRRLPEADKANMEVFITNLKAVLPLIGIDVLKPLPKAAARSGTTQVHLPLADRAQFEIRHKSGVKAFAVEEADEFIVLEGSEALKDTGYTGQSYAELKADLVEQGILAVGDTGDRYIFTSSYPFKSPSAASSIVLDRSSNGRWQWKVIGKKQTYHEWQSETSKLLEGAE